MIDIGFIGLGTMGRPMAGHLQAAGHKRRLGAGSAPSSDYLKMTKDIRGSDMFQLRQAKPDDVARNYDIWRTAVEASHHFLDASDREAIGKMVAEDYLPNARFVVAVDGNDLPHAFLGVTGDHIDALFVHADSRGMGAGRLLLGDQNLVDLLARPYARELGLDVPSDGHRGRELGDPDRGHPGNVGLAGLG